jgi:hypothetical protein
MYSVIDKATGRVIAGNLTLQQAQHVRDGMLVMGNPHVEIVTPLLSDQAYR